MTIPDRLAAALSHSYRIERELGQGGMATVYLAEDLKHKRHVALKVLKPELAAVLGAERFVQEIATTASLSHPHILPLFDSGEAGGFLFYVMPYVEGETLRARLDRETQLGVDEAVKIATEVADALDYAHQRGVIHRDIKPENILLQNGRPMVADFGIALAVSAAAGGRMTETGLSLGTPHYMSPEQATAEKQITARSDVYSLGSVLYEMLASQPPHLGGSAQQIIMKIIAEPAEAVTRHRKTVPSNVVAAVQQALEKLPADRFASAGDFARALGDPHFGERREDVAGPVRRRGRSTRTLTAVSGAAIAVAGFLIGRAVDRSASRNQLEYSQRTYVREGVMTARFTRDGRTIVYSASAEGSTPRIQVMRPEYPEPRVLGEPGMHLLAVSSKDEMAVLTGARYIAQRIYAGTLARMPLGGGAPRELLTNVRDADWSPDGASLAITHEVNGRDRLEYPIGTVLVESSGYLSDIRISPDGDRIAFFEHPNRWDDRGTVSVVDLKGKRTVLSPDYWGLQGLAWASEGGRVFFGGALQGGFFQGFAASLRGGVRLVFPNAGSITVHDVSSAGDWLVARDEVRVRLLVMAPGERQERDVSWLNRSESPLISADGRFLVFSNAGPDAGALYATMLRKTDGSPATTLGVGSMLAVSPDGRWVLASIPLTPQQLMLYPTGAGQGRRIDTGELESHVDARFLPAGTDIIVCGSERGRGQRCYVRPLAGGPLRPLTPEGTRIGVQVSPDGRWLAATTDSGLRLYPVDGGASRPIPGVTASEQVARFSPDGRALWVMQDRGTFLGADQIDIATGQRRPLMATVPGSAVGVLRLRDLSLADDPRSYAYTAKDYDSRIFVIKGIK